MAFFAAVAGSSLCSFCPSFAGLRPVAHGQSVDRPGFDRAGWAATPKGTVASLRALDCVNLPRAATYVASSLGRSVQSPSCLISPPGVHSTGVFAMLCGVRLAWQSRAVAARHYTGVDLRGRVGGPNPCQGREGKGTAAVSRNSGAGPKTMTRRHREPPTIARSGSRAV